MKEDTYLLCTIVTTMALCLWHLAHAQKEWTILYILELVFVALSLIVTIGTLATCILLAFAL